MKRFHIMVATWAVALFLSTGPAHGTSFSEVGDAGDLPAIAQVPGGVGSLDEILGRIGNPSDQDMFKIFISDPANFSASTNNPGTNLSQDSDTQLFLFDVNGMGLLANDDDPTAQDVRSNIPAGSFGGPPGLYFLAISIFDNDPVSAGGEIFDNDAPPLNDTIVGPSGPGGGSPIIGWSSDPFVPQDGPYRIALTAATFPPRQVVTAPASLLTLGIAIFGLLGYRSRRRMP